MFSGYQVASNAVRPHFSRAEQQPILLLRQTTVLRASRGRSQVIPVTDARRVTRGTTGTFSWKSVCCLDHAQSEDWGNSTAPPWCHRTL